MKQIILKLLILTAFIAVFGGTNVCAQPNNLLIPKDIIVNSLKVLESQRSWSAETVVTNDSNSRTSKFAVEFLAPNKSHAVFSIKGKVLIEAIMIGQDEYTKLDNKWEKNKKNKFDQLWEDLYKPVEGLQEKFMVNVEFVGKELIGGIGTSVYQYDFDIKALIKDFEKKLQLQSAALLQSKTKSSESFDEMKVKVWIKADGLPIKFESVRKTEESKGKIVAIKKTTTYRFDREIKFKAPRLVAGVKSK